MYEPSLFKLLKQIFLFPVPTGAFGSFLRILKESYIHCGIMVVIRFIRLLEMLPLKDHSEAATGSMGSSRSARCASVS